jgi:galactose oxidase-like protein
MVRTRDPLDSHAALSLLGLAALGAGIAAAPLPAFGAACNGTTAECRDGRFSDPFAEPTVLGVTTGEKCVTDTNGQQACKPAAGTLALLPDDRLIYFNALEGTENVELSIVAEFGTVSANDQTRVLSFDASGVPSWSRPTPVDAGANPDGSDPNTLPGVPVVNGGADGALFCSDVVFLADGRLLAAGGTDYYSEPGIPQIPYGVAELEGLKNARIFDGDGDLWSQTGSMSYGRWYPTLVSLPSSKVFVASGVTKLLKPVYPESITQSGRNVVQTETYDPACGTWSVNGPLAERTLPLFPRLHLLPNGHVYYNAGGQAFNPFGEGYDQALWNLSATYDPATQTWSDLAYAGLPLQLNQVGLQQLSNALNPTNSLQAATLMTLLSSLLGTVTSDPTALLNQVGGLLGLTADPDVVEKVIGSGMRGSTFSVMLPQKPDVNGSYRKAEFLTAGGVLTAVAATNPGTYLATNSSRIDSVSIATDGRISSVSRLTGTLPQARWYSSGVLLPTGEVFTVSGADRDEVATPGLGFAVKRAAIFDPQSETWKGVATQHNPRTYHNTAVLLRDGRVLVGGHAPINTAYLSNIDLSSLGFSPNDGRDPSFEIYSPPYMFRTRPTITNAPSSAARGATIRITTPNAASIETAILMRRTATTHLVDGDQHAPLLRIAARRTGSIDVVVPASAAVAPSGPYLLFVTMRASDGTRVPSVGAVLTIAGGAGSCAP